MEPLADRLYHRLNLGTTSAAELRLVAGGISAATLARTLRAMPDIIMIGKGRAMRYARRVDDDIPVHRIDEAGAALLLGQLAAVADGRLRHANRQGLCVQRRPAVVVV